MQRCEYVCTPAMFCIVGVHVANVSSGDIPRVEVNGTSIQVSQSDVLRQVNTNESIGKFN